MQVGDHNVMNKGMSGDEVSKLFSKLLSQVNDLNSSTDKDTAIKIIKQLEEEARKDDKVVSESRVRRLLKFLFEISPDIWEVAVTTLTNPIKGIGVVFRKIIERAKLERSVK